MDVTSAALLTNLHLLEGNWREARRTARIVYPRAWFPLLRFIKEMVELPDPDFQADKNKA